MVNESKFNSIHLLTTEQIKQIKLNIHLINELNRNPEISIHLVNESNTNKKNFVLICLIFDLNLIHLYALPPYFYYLIE